MTIFSSNLEVLYHALPWTLCCWMCVVPRIAALLRGGSGWSRLPAAYLLYSSTHTNAKQDKWSELRKETRRATKKTLQHVILMIKVIFMCVSCGFLQVCWWSSAAMCDQTFMAATFGPCDSCSKPSPLMNIYIKNEATNYCSLCVEMVMFSSHFHPFTSPQKWNKGSIMLMNVIVNDCNECVLLFNWNTTEHAPLMIVVAVSNYSLRLYKNSPSSYL